MSERRGQNLWTAEQRAAVAQRRAIVAEEYKYYTATEIARRHGWSEGCIRFDIKCLRISDNDQVRNRIKNQKHAVAIDAMHTPTAKAKRAASRAKTYASERIRFLYGLPQATHIRVSMHSKQKCTARWRMIFVHGYHTTDDYCTMLRMPTTRQYQRSHWGYTDMDEFYRQRYHFTIHHGRVLRFTDRRWEYWERKFRVWEKQQEEAV